MEEDIKMLENFIRIYKELDEKSTDFYFNKVEIPIEKIENLINKVKSQKKQIKLMKSVNLDEKYISKDKIREEFEKFTAHNNCFNLGDIQLLLDNILEEE